MKMNPNQDSLFRDLEKLNFSVNESKVYLTLIKLGSSLAGKIAKEAHLDRSSAYNALKALTQRGIVSTIFENKRTIYVPANPKKIVNYFQEKEELAKRIIPNLEKQFRQSEEKSSVQLFQGFKGLKTIFEDILDCCDGRNELLVMGTEGKFTEKMPYFAPIFRKRKEQRKIRTRLLVREGRTKKKRGTYTKAREVPSDVISPATINIYRGKIAMLIWDEQPKAILIENLSLSKTFKNYFNFMWKNSK